MTDDIPPPAEADKAIDLAREFTNAVMTMHAARDPVIRVDAQTRAALACRCYAAESQLAAERRRAEAAEAGVAHQLLKDAIDRRMAAEKRAEAAEKERDELRILAERAYPGLRESRICSRHRGGGHYECMTCYVDLPGLMDDHIAVKEGFREERDALRSRVAELEAGLNQERLDIENALEWGKVEVPSKVVERVKEAVRKRPAAELLKGRG